MTIIAWDGKTLAADRLLSGGNTKNHTVKIAKVQGHLIGAAGRGIACAAFVNWFKEGAEPEKFPLHEFGAEEPECNAMVITPQGGLLVFENSPVPMHFLDTQYAIGSGAGYARAAMHLGKSAAEACAVAIELDPNCGGPVDTLTLAGS